MTPINGKFQAESMLILCHFFLYTVMSTHSTQDHLNNGWKGILTVSVSLVK